MTAVSTVITAAGSLLLGTAAATAARGLRGLAQVDIEEICRRRQAAHLAPEIREGRHRAALGADCLKAICNAVYVAVIGIAAFAGAAPFGGDDGWRFAMAVALSALGLLIADVWGPQLFGHAGTNGFVIATWRLWSFVGRLLYPLVFVAEQAERFIDGRNGRNVSPPSETPLDGETHAADAEERREAELEEEAREMIEGVIQLGDAEVAQVMTPRTYMFSMRANLSFDEAVNFVISSGHTRIPVYDKNRDDVIGILHMKDLLPELIKPADRRGMNVVDLLRPAHFVPESKRLDELLQEFQKTRNHMAVVLDEYGGVSGVVTLEDVLEEIVGEIDDEYDEELGEDIKSLGERKAEVLARVHINEVNERLGTHLPEEGEFDTIGGFIFSHLGHIPAVGETVTVDDVRLTVIDVTRRRIERVRIEVLDPSAREMA